MSAASGRMLEKRQELQAALRHLVLGAHDGLELSWTAVWLELRILNNWVERQKEDGT